MFGTFVAWGDAPLNAESHPLMLNLTLRYQRETSVGSGRFHIVTRGEQWKPEETAIIVCDVWDYHHSINAVRRLREFAPRLDAVLTKARHLGVTIIHSPSDCMDAYADHPARLRAIHTPRASRTPHDIASWCSQIPAEERAVYPIDQSDGGDDDAPDEHAEWESKLADLGRNPALPWERQSPLITIDPDRDFISDRGDEVWNVLESRGIRNVILTGVHVNMCVLGRPFGLRQMARNGKHVVLMRDLTDAMYNPQRWPYVSHFAGNDLVVSHIERFVCPTVTSDQTLGGKPFRFSKDERPHVVVVIAENPYDTKTTLPRFVTRQLGNDFRVTVLHADDFDRNRIPGLEAVQSADLLVLSIRRRLLPADDMAVLRTYIADGKPVLAIRSSSHAFTLRRDQPRPEIGDDQPLVDWPEFDAEVIGGNYTGSYPDELRSTVRVAPTDKLPSVLSELKGLPFVQGGHMYKTSPLKPGCTPLLNGFVDGHAPEPVAWIFNRADGGRTIYAALGHPDDFQQSAFVGLLTNSCYWLTNQPIPQPSTARSPVDEYRLHWSTMAVPSTWDAGSNGVLKGIDEPGWYRCVLYIPEDWAADERWILKLGGKLSASRVRGYVNGVELQADGEHVLTMPPSAITAGDHNLLVLQVDGSRTALTSALVLESLDGERRLPLRGMWQFRLGNNDSFSSMPLPAKFGGGADIVFAPEVPLWQARILTRPGEFTSGIEGPACDSSGNLFAVNYARQGTIGRITPDGSGEVFVTLPEGSIGNGIRFDRNGNFYVADYTGHNVLKVDPTSKKVTVHAHNEAMNQPNDLAIAGDGTLYASDPNWKESTGQIWRIDTDGSTHLVATDLGTTNGIDLSPDGKTLYVNESVQRNVWAFTITDDKSLTEQRLVRQFEDNGFDGMRTDTDGNLYITRYGKGTVVKMSPTGEVLREIDVLGLRPSNICFGGHDGRTAYVTEVESTRITTFRVDSPGRSFSSTQER